MFNIVSFLKMRSSFSKSKESIHQLSVPIALKQLKLTSNLEGVLVMTQECACVLLVHFRCTTCLVLIKVVQFSCWFVSSVCRKHGQRHSAIAAHIVVVCGIASVLFTVTRATPLCGAARQWAAQVKNLWFKTVLQAAIPWVKQSAHSGQHCFEQAL